MVSDGVKLQQQQQQQPHTGSSSIEDDAVKRNTDCVYFLASPLTCKKGSDCEYRHSEYARINPRDCWFWMNGNCLNPKCSFRHPPLDGLLGSQVEPSVGSSLTPSKPVVSSSMHSNASKQSVPCIFFQKGMCLKADKCTFLHGSNAGSIKPPQIPKPSSMADPLAFKRPFAGLAKCSQEQNISQGQITEEGEVRNVKQLQKVEKPPLKNETFIPKYIPHNTNFNGEIRSKPNISPLVAENSISRANHIHLSDDVSLDNGIDADEPFRESSPGFDVLVDDDLRDPDFYHDDDHQFGRTRCHEHPIDYDSMIDIDGERFHDSHDFNSSYPLIQGPFDRSSSPEGKLMGKSCIRKRGYAQVEAFDQIDKMDLRHRLSKHKRVSPSLRSIVCLDSDVQSHTEEPRYQERSLHSRLAGRIVMPSNPFPINGNHNFNSDIDLEMRRNRRTGRPQIPSQVGRFKERVKEGMLNDGRNPRGTDFAAPKTLAELKGGKSIEKKESLSSQKQYEGPRPPNAILKMKRETSGDDEARERKDVDEETKSDAIVDDGLIESEMEDQEQDVDADADADADAIDYEGIYGKEDELLEEEDEYLEEIDGEEEDEFAKRMNAIFS